jgi:DNA (cytosine-5)-methyltransferase 1
MIKILDLFCGSGGCSVGYYRAFSQYDDVLIVGVDMVQQPNYPYHFIQGDAIDLALSIGHQFDFIHASPPCQPHSQMNRIHKKHYKDYIALTRTVLDYLQKPYVIENVPNAPLGFALILQGDMFNGLKVVRKRHFETSFYCKQPAIPIVKHGIPSAGRGASPDGFVSVVGTGGLGGGLTSEYANEAMGIDWMSRAELSQAIPPQYTQYIGSQWLGIGQPDMLVMKQLSLFAA